MATDTKQGNPTAITVEHATITVAGPAGAVPGVNVSATATPATPNAATVQGPFDDKHIQGINKINAEIKKYQNEITKTAQKVEDLKSKGDYSKAAELEQANGIRQHSITQMENLKTKYTNTAMAAGEFNKQLNTYTRESKGATTPSYLKDMRDAAKHAMHDFDPIVKLIGAAGPFYAAKGFKSGLDSINSWSGGLADAQKTAMDFAKNIESMGVGMGKPFKDAEKDAKGYTQAYSDTMKTTRASKEVIASVQTAFKNMIDPAKQMDAMKTLKCGMGELKSSLNATNVAILTGAANNMDAGKAAGWMATSMTKLGASSETAALSMGKIGWAAKDSGLGFETVGDAIMQSADSLKMFGGTVNSVTPLYKSFAASLAGTGKQGLTPELLQSFVGGLRQMSLGARALMGMQMPGMAGKGALGAGLEMEAAMEDKTGAGMKKITESITATLKNFGGGKILTREEARQTGQEQQFLQQRGIIQQQLGISDVGTANKMMEALQNIDKNGMDTGGDQVDALKDMMNSGEKINQTNQSLQDAADNALQQATVQNGKDIVGAIEKLGERMGLGPVIAAAKNEVVSGFPDADVTKLMNRAKGKKQESKGGEDKAGAGQESKTFLGNAAALLKNLGGTKLLTMDEAKRTGQEQRFVQQRGMVQKQFGTDVDTANKIMVALQSINKSTRPTVPATIAQIQKLTQPMPSVLGTMPTVTPTQSRVGQVHEYMEYKRKGGKEKFEDFEKEKKSKDLAAMMAKGTPVQTPEDMDQQVVTAAVQKEKSPAHQAKEHINKASMKPNVPQTAEAIKQAKASRTDTKQETPATTTEKQQVSKTIDVDVNLKARVHGTSITIDIAPAVNNAMRNAAQNH